MSTLLSAINASASALEANLQAISLIRDTIQRALELAK
jgi:hypothetical protein